MKNIHVLPTDKPSRTYKIDSIGKLDWSEGYLHQVDGATNQNIYITNSEEIKEGDYFPLYGEWSNKIEGFKKWDGKLILMAKGLQLKIILTTDKDLDGVQPIDDEFLEWFVKNPSCEEVETEITDRDNNGYGIPFGVIFYKIIIPKEEVKIKDTMKHIRKFNEASILKTNNIHVLPTNKPSRLQLNVNTKTLILFNNIQSNNESAHLTTQNIYITSDEEIKEGDWCLPFYNYKVEVTEEYPIYKMKNGDFYCQDKKIILTTDQELIKDGVQPIDDEFLEWFVQNPSCEEVDIKKLKSGKYWLHKTIIPKGEPKQTDEKGKPMTDTEII